MPIQRRSLEQLSTSKSWQSPVAVIAHIDLDAFYAQCLGVHHGIDPSEPLCCRQWNSLIAINYPAREYGLKRGVSVEEARKLCPQVHLPHVATFKKGELHWDFHDEPDPNGYKVSLDHFRKESRRIFAVFKQHFKAVEKAGIDEGFVDLGPEVYKEVMSRHPNIKTQLDGEVDLDHDDLLDIGAELVNKVRLEIHERLHYTCSAGIAANKLLAKLGSGYNKPFNQTVVHASQVNEFLANFRITDAWGWGGKLGKDVLEALEISEDIENQCEFVRDNFTLADLQKRLKGNVKVARNLYDMVRGHYLSEITPRTLIKSMVAVKDFRKLNHLQSREDVESWLRVFSADLSGRLSDLQEDLGCVFVPKTISVKQYHNGSLSKQQPFSIAGSSIPQLREQIYNQSAAIAKTFVQLPCTYLVVEISHLYELPKERLYFQKQSGPVPQPPPNLPEEESLFVEDETESQGCSRCGQKIPVDSVQEHNDWHFAMDLQKQHNKEEAAQNLLKRRAPAHSPSTGPQRKAKPKSSAKKDTAKKDAAKQKSIFEFFK